MGLYDPKHRFHDYLDNMKDYNQGKCWFCNKDEEDIKREYFEYMKNPDQNFEDVNFEDLIIITYKLKKPVCAGCYFSIKKNPSLVKEIMDRPEDDVWSE